MAPVKEDAPTPPDTPIKSTSDGHAIQKRNGSAKSGGDKTDGDYLTPEDLSNLAREFAKEIPDDMFSPAAIQGFLLKRNNHPRRAVEEVRGWVEGMKEAKKNGRMLGDVVIKFTGTKRCYDKKDSVVKTERGSDGSFLWQDSLYILTWKLLSLFGNLAMISLPQDSSFLRSSIILAKCVDEL